MDFVIGLPISTNWKGKSCDSILVIIDELTKMVLYELVKVTINTLALDEVILNVVIQHYGIYNLIVSDRSLLFTLKFWLLLNYFFDIKQRLSTAFHA